VPALVGWGAKDAFAGAQYAERQREFFDVQRAVILPDSGHWPFVDGPAAVNDALLLLLRTQLPAAPLHSGAARALARVRREVAH
jgi:pimeloyl-ACP methyl ester carboxylesterase